MPEIIMYGAEPPTEEELGIAVEFIGLQSEFESRELGKTYFDRI